MDEGKPVAANRMLAAVRRMFGWCVERDLLEHSPADRVAAPGPNSSRERVLDEQELAAIWKAAGSIGHPYGHMIRLLILTGLRRQEVAGMEWNELDLDGKLWTIPAVRMKKSREQLVPLSDAALKVIAELQKVRIKDAKYVFTLNGKKPVNGFSAAKKELDEEIKKVAGWTIDNWTFHDIRRTLSTGLAEMGVNLQVAEKILAHESGSLAGVAGIYNRYTFLEERREALDRWATHVMALEVREDATAE